MSAPPPSDVLRSSASRLLGLLAIPGDTPLATRASLGKLRTMEAGRGIAACVVLFAHALDETTVNPTLHRGAVFGGLHWSGLPGVEFFFVLSGFVMILAHEQDFGHLRRIPIFLWRRFCRIYPLFWLVMAVLLWRYWELPQITWARIVDMLSLWPASSDNLLTVAWSLRQEVMFYAVLALGMLPRIGLPLLFGWIGVTFWLGPSFGVWPLPQWSWIVFNPFNVEFCAGMACAWLLRRWQLPTRASIVLLAGSIGGLAWRLSFDHWGMEFGPFVARLAYGASYGGIIVALASLERSGALRLGRWAWLAGAMSYPLYLCHNPVVLWLGDWLANNAHSLNWTGEMIVALLVSASLLAAFGFTFLVDRPLQRLLRRI